MGLCREFQYTSSVIMSQWLFLQLNIGISHTFVPVSPTPILPIPVLPMIYTLICLVLPTYFDE